MSKSLGLVLGLCLVLASGPVSASSPKSHTKPTKTAPQGLGIVSGQSSTILPNGNLLVLGGEGPDGPVSTAAIKNSQTGEVHALANGLLHPRYGHTATILPNGNVLIFGGITTGGNIETAAEFFDPTTEKFQNVPETGLTARVYHTATVLTDGRVLFVGGLSNSRETLGTIEAWSFQTNTATLVPQILLVPRSKHTATLLADGTVEFWGGFNQVGATLDFGEVFDPATERSSLTAMPPSVDSQSPQLEASLPVSQATGVPPTSLVSLRFSEPLSVTTLTEQTVTLSGPRGSVPASVVPVERGMLAFVSPGGALQEGTTFTLTIHGAIDPEGNPLPAVSISFTTSGPVSSTGNSPISSSSNNNADLWAPTAANFQGSWTSGKSESPWQKLPSLEAKPSVTALSGQALRLNGSPLQGVTLQIGSEKTTTDATGRFLLPNLASGHEVLLIDGTTATKQGRAYGVFEVGVDITAGKTTTLSYTIWMTAIDTAHAVTIPSPTTAATVVTTPLLPGLELHLPANAVIRDHNGRIVTKISISPIPIDQPPFPLPAGVSVPIYFTIQPGDAYIDTPTGSWVKGAQLYYPNSHNAMPGTRMDFWNYDAEQKGWYVYGMGTVSPNGTQIIPDPGVEIYQFTGAMVAFPTYAPSSGPNWLCTYLGLFCGGEPVDLGSGLFVYEKTDLYLPDVIPIRLARTYRQNDTTSRAFGIGTTHNYDIFLVGSRAPWTYADIVMPEGGRIECPNTASDQGQTYTDALFVCNSTPGPFFGATMVWNGNGWNLKRKDGTLYQFPDGFDAVRAQQGALLSITDRNGNTLSITRDSNSNITQITSPNGRWVQLTYDTNYRITQAQDNSGRTVQYSYDSGGRLTNVTDAGSGVWKYNYDSSDNMTSLVDPLNITYLQNQYDSQNRVIKQTLADGVSTYQFSYNPGCTNNCSVISETDVTNPNGNIEKVLFGPPQTYLSGFAAGGQGSSATYAAGTSVSQAYSYQYQTNTNLLASLTDALNRVTSFGYDSLGNLTSVTRLSGTSNATTTSFTYDPTFSQLTSVMDPLGHTTSLSLDPKGNLISVADPLGNTSVFVNNSEGQLVSVADPLGHTTTLAYSGGDLSSITDPLGRTTSVFLDAGGRPVSRTDPLGEMTKISYNALNQPTQIDNPAGGITSLSYDANGNLLSVTDANSHTTNYVYSNMGLLSSRRDPLNRTESYQYNGNGNPTQFTDRRGKVTTYTYDALNRRIFAGFGKSGGTYESTINNSYDAGNRLTQAIDSITGTISRTYDGLNRTTQETTPHGSVSYNYDAASRRTSMTAGGQSAVNYAYDNANRLTQITQGTSTVVFAYDTANRRTSLKLPNGVTMSYGYDSASEVTGINYTLGSNALGNLTYSYDLAGRRASVGGSYAVTGLPQPTSGTAYDAANELTRWGTATPTYDSNGNVLSDGTNSYSWDARNHLVSMNSGGASFQYDPFGRRVAKTLLITTTNYLYDGVNPVQELAGATPTANLVTGGLDQYFQRTDSNGPANFSTEALGSTLALTDPNGNTLAQYTYEPFGNTTITGSSANPYQYTGRENDNTGIYFYRSRYYSPTFQRFVSEDPTRLAGGDTNFYAYARNSPTNLRDPSGRNPLAIALCVGGGAAGAFFYHEMAGRKATFAGYAASAGGGCAAGLMLAFGAGLAFDMAAEFAAEAAAESAADAATAPTYVFYSGPGAEEAATAWAEANNGITIWDTEWGAAFDNGSMTAEEASEGYANSASGTAQVFSSDPLTNYGNIWYNTEFPIVANNPNVGGIAFHLSW